MSDKFANDEDKAAIEEADEIYSRYLMVQEDEDRVIYQLWLRLNQHFIQLDYGNSDGTEDDMLDEILDVVDRRFRKRAKLDQGGTLNEPTTEQVEGEEACYRIGDLRERQLRVAVKEYGRDPDGDTVGFIKYLDEQGFDARYVESEGTWRIFDTVTCQSFQLTTWDGGSTARISQTI